MAEHLGRGAFSGGVANTTVTPSTGSTGFSSRHMVFANASGQLTNNTSSPVWDSTQNFMGIGTTSPVNRLMISNANNGFEFNPSVAGGLSLLQIYDRAGGTSYGRLAMDTSAFQVRMMGQEGVGMNINSSGHVGIGTTNPTFPLSVGSTAANGSIKIQDAAGNPFLDFFSSGATRQGILQAVEVSPGAGSCKLQGGPGYKLQFGANGVDDRVTLSTAGLLGIGTTTPGSFLDVQGTSNSEVVRFSGFSSAGTTLGPVMVIHSTGTTQKLSFWSTLGSTKAPAITTQSTAGQTTSDIRNLQVAVNSLIDTLKNYGLTA